MDFLGSRSTWIYLSDGLDYLDFIRRTRTRIWFINELDYLDLDCYGKRMVPDMVGQRIWLRIFEKGKERVKQFWIYVVVTLLVNFGVWIWEGKEQNWVTKTFDSWLGYQWTDTTIVVDSTSYMATPQRSLYPQRQSPRPP